MRTGLQPGGRGAEPVTAGADGFRAEFVAALRRRPRFLPSKFLYDERGAGLFEEICGLPEYYPARTETAILAQNIRAIAECCGRGCVLVELGSGSSRKTRLLLDHLDEPVAYVPIDISGEFLQEAARGLAAEYPALEVLPICADFNEPVDLPALARPARRTVLFFPGSTIGNFEPRAAAGFLTELAVRCRPGDRLLIGVDLVKSPRLIELAYNDARGVTAAFNLNLLARANREFGADFRLDGFAHEAIYDQARGRIEMRLVSLAEQVVTIDGECFGFGAGEQIVTEYSYKYRPATFAHLARGAGWEQVARWSDERTWFSVFALERP